MKKPLIIQADRTIRLRGIVVSHEQEITLKYALSAYGFVLADLPPGEYSLTEFADKIAAVYNGSVPQTAAVLRTLDEVQQQTDNYVPQQAA